MFTHVCLFALCDVLTFNVQLTEKCSLLSSVPVIFSSLLTYPRNSATYNLYKENSKDHKKGTLQNQLFW